jgi:hypothetical protein
MGSLVSGSRTTTQSPIANAVMPTAPTLARLAVALVSVANATAALTFPKAIAGASPKASFAMGIAMRAKQP